MGQIGAFTTRTRPAFADRVEPREFTSRQRQPGLRIGLDDRGWGPACVPNSRDHLDRGVRRDPHLDRVSRRSLLEDAEVMLDQRTRIALPGRRFEGGRTQRFESSRHSPMVVIPGPIRSLR